MKNLPKINLAKALKASLPYLIAGLLCTKLGEAYRLTTGGDVIDRLLAAFTKLGQVFQNPFPSLHPFDLLVGAAAAVLLRLVVWSKIKNAKKYRHGEEYGTARWGNEKDIAPFINSDFSQNILLTDTERLTLGKIADPEKRNLLPEPRGRGEDHGSCHKVDYRTVEVGGLPGENTHCQCAKALLRVSRLQNHGVPQG